MALKRVTSQVRSGCSSGVELLPSKQKAVGSNPIARSSSKGASVRFFFLLLILSIAGCGSKTHSDAVSDDPIQMVSWPGGSGVAVAIAPHRMITASNLLYGKELVDFEEMNSWGAVTYTDPTDRRPGEIRPLGTTFRAYYAATAPVRGLATFATGGEEISVFLEDPVFRVTGPDLLPPKLGSPLIQSGRVVGVVTFLSTNRRGGFFAPCKSTIIHVP